MDPVLDKKLTEAALRFRGTPEALRTELERIRREHDEIAAGWRRFGPLVIGLMVVIIVVICVRL